jgi:chemotaxis protein MotA
MDKATLIGILGALGFVVGSNVMEGGSPAALFKIPAMLLVIGGTFGAGMAGGTMADFKGAIAGAKRAFTWKAQPAGELVPVVVELAGKARREGLLTLEDAVNKVDDDFLKRGVKLAVDGTDPEELREIMECELMAKKASDKHVAKFWADCGGYAPTIGIIGTVMGLVHVLQNLSQPDKLGELISAAFIATLWGVMTANVIFLPIGNRLTRLGQIEAARMELVIEGVLAVQAGANPRAVQQRLTSLLPENERDVEAKAA